MMAPPTIHGHGGKLVCLYDCGQSDPVYGGVFLAGLLCALVYGLALAGRSPSWPRTVIKTIPVAALAICAVLLRAPLLLTVGLAFCAVGDAFLSRDPQKWLPWGLVAFLLGHAAYIALFVQFTDPMHVDGPPQFVAWSLVAVAAFALLAFVWKHTGPLRPAVVLYAIVIAVMVGASFRLTPYEWPAMAGAVAFVASDAILAISLFRGEVLFGSTRLTNWAVWFLYFGAQLAIWRTAVISGLM